jgi:hypothetical protein
MYNVLHRTTLKIHSVWKKRARVRRRELKKIDRIKDSTTNARLLFCIFRVYFIFCMSCLEMIWWEFNNHWKIFRLIQNLNRREKKIYKIKNSTRNVRFFFCIFRVYFISFMFCLELIWWKFHNRRKICSLDSSFNVERKENWWFSRSNIQQKFDENSQKTFKRVRKKKWVFENQISKFRRVSFERMKNW